MLSKTQKSLPALALVLLLLACSSSKLDRVITALHAAEALPAVLGLSPQQVTCAEEGFRGVTLALEGFKENPNDSAWRQVALAVDRVKISSCYQHPRLEAIVKVVVRMILSIHPTPTLAAEGEDLPPPKFGSVDDADVKKLEALVRRQRR